MGLSPFSQATAHGTNSFAEVSRQRDLMPAQVSEYHLAATHRRPLIHNVFLNLAARVVHADWNPKRTGVPDRRMTWASCIVGL